VKQRYQKNITERRKGKMETKKISFAVSVLLLMVVLLVGCAQEGNRAEKGGDSRARTETEVANEQVVTNDQLVEPSADEPVTTITETAVDEPTETASDESVSEITGLILESSVNTGRLLCVWEQTVHSHYNGMSLSQDEKSNMLTINNLSTGEQKEFPVNSSEIGNPVNMDVDRDSKKIFLFGYWGVTVVDLADDSVFSRRIVPYGSLDMISNGEYCDGKFYIRVYEPGINDSRMEVWDANFNFIGISSQKWVVNDFSCEDGVVTDLKNKDLQWTVSEDKIPYSVFRIGENLCVFRYDTMTIVDRNSIETARLTSYLYTNAVKYSDSVLLAGWISTGAGSTIWQFGTNGSAGQMFENLSGECGLFGCDESAGIAYLSKSPTEYLTVNLQTGEVGSGLLRKKDDYQDGHHREIFGSSVVEIPESDVSGGQLPTPELSCRYIVHRDSLNFPQNDVFADIIVRLLEDASLYQKMSHDAVEWARGWDWDLRAEKVFNFMLGYGEE